MRLLPITLAAAAASLGIAMGAAPAAADCITSPTDISCGPANQNPANPLSPLNPASPFYPKPAAPPPPVAAPGGYGYGYGYGAAPAYGSGGLLGALLGIEPPAPATIVTPGDGYEPGDTRILRHRHRHRRVRHAE